MKLKERTQATITTVFLILLEIQQAKYGQMNMMGNVLNKLIVNFVFSTNALKTMGNNHEALQEN